MLVQQEQGISVRIDPQEWYRLKKDLDAADKKLVTVLRKRIKNAGNIAAQAVKDALAETPPRGAPDPDGFRAALSQATTVRVSFGQKSAGVKIATASRLLPEGQKPLLAAYNTVKFRHPLFADASTARSTWTWYPQVGKPYFGAAIREVIDSTIQAEIMAALDDAVKAIGGRIR